VQSVQTAVGYSDVLRTPTSSVRRCRLDSADIEGTDRVKMTAAERAGMGDRAVRRTDRRPPEPRATVSAARWRVEPLLR